MQHRSLTQGLRLRLLFSNGAVVALRTSGMKAKLTLYTDIRCGTHRLLAQRCHDHVDPSRGCRI